MVHDIIEFLEDLNLPDNINQRNNQDKKNEINLKKIVLEKFGDQMN